jgi:hypothetical protein
MANCNPKTGIPYGVISGNNVPELTDDIFSGGDSLTYRAWKEEVAERIKGAIKSAIDDYTCRAEKIVEGLDYPALVDSLLDHGLGEDWQCEEEEFEYQYDTDYGPVKLQLGWLGGAPLIWVLDSPWFANCKHCSPCVPGAGDLDSPVDNGLECYCLPPDDMPDDWKGQSRLIANSKHYGD